MGDPSTISDQFTMVVMQHETLCNLNCDYCYLPQRRTHNAMPVEIAQRVAASVAAQQAHPDAPDHVTIMWHAGEPLAASKRHFVGLLNAFEPLRRAGHIRHGVQTNGTLVDSDWCAILNQYGFEVGVSLDGPEEMNFHRSSMNGRPAYRQVMEGIAFLRAYGIDPSVIGVVTPDTITRGRDIIRFFHEQGFRQIALNVETREGANLSRPLVSAGAARKFWYDVFSYIIDTDAPVKLRTLRTIMDYVHGLPSPTRDSIPTVTWQGEVILASPELAGMKDRRYADFISGNVLNESIPAILAYKNSIPYVAEFQLGLARCQRHCTYWDACHGSYAATRWAERGRLDITETSACRATRQAPILALYDLAIERGDEALTTQLTHLIPWSN